MIHGIGADLVDIRRVEKLLEDYGSRFERRVFTPSEQTNAAIRVSESKRNNRVARYAKYIAAKEATYKALGVGRDSGIGWLDVEVNYAKTGQPVLVLSEAAQAIIGEAASTHLSLSDEYPYAQAFVIISR